MRPTLAKIAWAASTVGRWKSANKRFPYHACDSDHACSIVIVAPR